MRPIGVRVTGLNKVVRDLQTLGLEIEDLKEVFSELAAEGASYAAGFAPRRTGALRTSVRGNRAKNKAVIAAGRARVKYAGPINYGWKVRNIKPAFFMQKANKIMRPKALNALEDAIETKIARKGLK